MILFIKKLMKGKKWIFTACLYSLALVLSLVISSFVFTNKTSALKYSYNAIPLYRDIIQTSSSSGSTSPTFNIQFSSSTYPSFNDNLFSPSISGYELCSYSSYPQTYSIFDSGFVSSSSTFNILSRLYFSKLRYNYDPSISCYGSSISAFPATRWDYDSIYTAEYNLSTGDVINLVSIPDAFFDIDDPLRSSGSLKSLSVPLNLGSESLSSIPSGTLMEWDFGLVGFDNFPYLSDNITASLDLSYYTLDPNSSSPSDFANSYKTTTSIPPSLTSPPVCSVNYDFTTSISTGDLQILPLYGFNVHCSYTAPSNLYFIYPTLILSSSSRILDYNSNSSLLFSGSYFITEGDDTWSGLFANATPTGDNLSRSPGYSQLYSSESSSCSSGDWFCNLTNLFNFSVFNPFAPLFSLFSNGESCSHIPIIAGMLHSENDEYCAWFPSEVRNVLTPVFSLASVMLVFGFIVRWLGSSSGNFFEDSKSEEVSNQGGRWGHFKRGGK